jgi:hypothetical protein
VSAVEMFTNFNNGMELGFRPYGIPEFPPVRYHSWQPQSWYLRHPDRVPCGIGQFQQPAGVDQAEPIYTPAPTIPAPPAPKYRSDNGPVELRGEPAADVSVSPSERDDAAGWVRGQSFMPTSPAN